MVTKIPLQLLDCAPSKGREPLARSAAKQLASTLKAVSDPTRLQILALIATSQDKESCVCDLWDPLNLSQPTISHHLKKLAEAGLVTSEKRGTWVWYSLNQERWGEIAGFFGKDLLGMTLATCGCNTSKTSEEHRCQK